MSIGSNIKKWRELRNLKQSELAEMVGVSNKTISSWEINRTEPKMGMIEKVSSALNCKKTDIIGMDNASDEEYAAQTIAAYFNGDKYTEDELEEIIKYAQYIKSRRK